MACGVLLVFEHGTAAGPPQLQVERAIVMSGTRKVMSGEMRFKEARSRLLAASLRLGPGSLSAPWRIELRRDPSAAR